MCIMRETEDIMSEYFEMPDTIEGLKNIIEKSGEIHKSMKPGQDKRDYADKRNELIDVLGERQSEIYIEYL